MEHVGQLAEVVNRLSGTVNHLSQVVMELEEQLYQLLDAHLSTARIVERHERLLQQLLESSPRLAVESNSESSGSTGSGESID